MSVAFSARIFLMATRRSSHRQSASKRALIQNLLLLLPPNPKNHFFIGSSFRLFLGQRVHLPLSLVGQPRQSQQYLMSRLLQGDKSLSLLLAPTTLTRNYQKHVVI